MECHSFNQSSTKPRNQIIGTKWIISIILLLPVNSIDNIKDLSIYEIVNYFHTTKHAILWIKTIVKFSFTKWYLFSKLSKRSLLILKSISSLEIIYSRVIDEKSLKTWKMIIFTYSYLKILVSRKLKAIKIMVPSPIHCYKLRILWKIAELIFSELHSW